ncbi:universal stress protein [Mucilaginibacter sp. PAMB04168]|uniref:universal stress protein n=1 Tax=Mucilaginibacter sp. PAMB04168 TaxID=3138567 RepID=UPI0031F63B1B
MKNILLLNDFSPEAAHALAYGQMLAAHLQVNLLVWDIDEPKKATTAKVLVHVAAKNSTIHRPTSAATSKSVQHSPVPATNAKTLQLMETVNKTVHEIVLEQNVQLIIKGTKSIFSQVDEFASRVLCTTYCPVLLVPKDAAFRPLKRMVYMADLRYCRYQISSYLRSMAHVFKSSYSIAHISASGLPEPEENYAISLFQKIAGRRNDGIKITFNHIKERNVKKAADVLINTMHNDLIAMAYRRFHFKSLTDQQVQVAGTDALPVPLLLFPS